MEERWVSQLRGSSANPGTRELPWKEISDTTGVGGVDALIWIDDGEYDVSAADFGVAPEKSYIALGRVIFNVNNADYMIHWRLNTYDTYFSGITFRNFKLRWYGGNTGTYPNIYAVGCRFEQVGANYKARTDVRIAALANAYFSECLMYGFDGVLDNEPGTYTGNSQFVNSLFHDTTAPYVVCQNCAGSDAVVHSQPGGIDSGAIAPPFEDISTPSDPILNYDRAKPNFSTYSNGGLNNASIGVPWDVRLHWPQKVEVSVGEEMAPYMHLGSSDTHGLGAWENYEHWWKMWVDVTIQAGVNDTWSYTQSAITKIATIAPGTYTSLEDWVAALNQSFIDSTPPNGSPVVFWPGWMILYQGFNVGDCVFHTNTYTSNTAWEFMGLDSPDEDIVMPANLYSGMLEGSTDAIGPSYDGGNLVPGYVEPATGSVYIGPSSAITLPPIGSLFVCGVVSPVMKLGSRKRIRSINLSKSEDGSGGINTTRDLPADKCYIRAGVSEFEKMALPGTTEVDWTEVSHDMADLYAIIERGYDYWQLLLMPRDSIS